MCFQPRIVHLWQRSLLNKLCNVNPLHRCGQPLDAVLSYIHGSPVFYFFYWSFPSFIKQLLSITICPWLFQSRHSLMRPLPYLVCIPDSDCTSLCCPHIFSCPTRHDLCLCPAMFWLAINTVMRWHTHCAVLIYFTTTLGFMTVSSWSPFTTFQFQLSPILQ